MLQERKYWADYLLEDFEYAPWGSGAKVLDLGCGPGHQMEVLRERGCDVVGLDVRRADLEACRDRGLSVFMAVGEDLPMADDSVDGILCKVVIPLTDEEKVLEESARLMRPGAWAVFTYHGAGYYLQYALSPGAPSFKHRLYGARTLLATWYYALFGRRLPGWIGDTLYQSHARLDRYYRRFGFKLEQESPAPRFMGLPVFIYHELSKI